MLGSAPPTDLILFVAFLVAMPVVAFLSGRLRLPYTVALVIVGLAVSALPIQEKLVVSPDLVTTALAESSAVPDRWGCRAGRRGRFRRRLLECGDRRGARRGRATQKRSS